MNRFKRVIMRYRAECSKPWAIGTACAMGCSAKLEHFYGVACCWKEIVRKRGAL